MRLLDRTMLVLALGLAAANGVVPSSSYDPRLSHPPPPPASPCPLVFRYESDPESPAGWRGVIRLLAPPRFSSLHLMVQLAAPQHLPSEPAPGTLSLRGGVAMARSLVRATQQGRRTPIEFLADFSCAVTMVPVLLNITVNGRVFCAAMQEPPDTKSTISLATDLETGLEWASAGDVDFSTAPEDAKVTAPSDPSPAGRESPCAPSSVAVGDTSGPLMDIDAVDTYGQPPSSPPSHVYMFNLPSLTRIPSITLPPRQPLPHQPLPQQPLPQQPLPQQPLPQQPLPQQPLPQQPLPQQPLPHQPLPQQPLPQQPLPQQPLPQPALQPAPHPASYPGPALPPPSPAAPPSAPLEAPRPAPIVTSAPTTRPNNEPPQNLSINEDCGRVWSSAANPLVTRGAAAVRGRWPWLVALFKKLGRRDQLGLNFECGSTLVSKRHVVTAAHCVEVRGRRGRPVDPASLVVYLGKHDLLSYTEPGQKTAEVEAVRMHPDYGRSGESGSSTSFNNDIALLLLSDPVQPTEHIRPVCLWDAALGGSDVDPVVGKIGAVPGWGKDDTGAISNEIRVANMPIVSQETCLRSNVFYHAFTSNTTFCAGFRNGTSVCNGDSGGGLFLLDKDDRWRIRGIVSVSMFSVNDQSCDAYNYAVFTDVAKFLPWLYDQMNSLGR